MKTYLIRHGQTIDDFNKKTQTFESELLLNKEVETRLEKIKSQVSSVNHIYASPMKRAQQTATHLFGPKGYEILDFTYEYPTPSEICDVPSHVAVDYWQVKHLHDKMNVDWVPEGSESFRSISERAQKLHTLLTEKKKNESPESIAVVGHGTFFKHFLLHAAGIPYLSYPQLFFDVIRKLKWDNLHVVEIDM